MRNIITIEVYKKHKKEEITQVCSLTGNIISCWSLRIQPEGAFWVNDVGKIIPGAGGKKSQTLIYSIVGTIANLRSKTDKELNLLQKSITGISLTTLNKWRTTTASPGSSPGKNTDYRKLLNLYLEKYGTND